MLAALAPLPEGDWVGAVQAAALSADLKTSAERQVVRIAGGRRTAERIQFSDDIVLSRLWIARGRHALAARPHRRYYDPATGEVDRRHERTIVGDLRPTGPTAADIVDRCHDILTRLGNGLGTSVDLAEVELLQWPVPRISIRATTAPNGDRLNHLYRAQGFERVPEDWIVSICPLEGVSERTALDVATRLERCARQRSAVLTTQTVDLDTITEYLGCLTFRRPIPGRSVLFVLPTKHRPPSSTTTRVLAAMDAASVKYRRSYADDPLDYSIPDQLPSILLASGGLPHSISCPAWQEGVWSIGIDLSHSKEAGAESTLAYTLIDPSGSLSGAWVTRQRRDESVSLLSLLRGLEAIRARLVEVDAEDSPVVVIRDGRLFERESTAAFSRALGNPFLLVEYRKRRNPPTMTLMPSVQPLDGPYAVRVPNASTLFLAPAPSRSAVNLPNVAKVTWRSNWNQLDWTAEQIASFLVSQTLTPGLGLHRRTLPAALYWADGIAGADDTNLRFRGNAPIRI